MSTQSKKKRKPESFDSWCRRNRVAPGDPTPAVSSLLPHSLGNLSTEAYRVALKGCDTMPALTTTLEVFCLRTERVFRVKGADVMREQYDPGWGREICHYRNLIVCKGCSDKHVLLSEMQAAAFGLVGDPIGGPRITQKDRSFFRRMNRQLFDRKKYPPLKRATTASKAA